MQSNPTPTQSAELLTFRVQGTPVPAGSKVSGLTKDGRKYYRDQSGQRGRKWREIIQQEAILIMRDREILVGPLSLRLDFTVKRGKTVTRQYPTVAPDTTKLIRAVEDALNKLVWKDDSQVVNQSATKRYGDVPGVDVLVSRIDLG